jgi:16S rRNA U516 pseudouridylate synthase RsuA-like enzyme
MCDAIAHPVERLRRTRIGTITAQGLGIGELRDLTAAEVRVLAGAARPRARAR